ncbi:hypothetical protein [Pseudonocardia parietis]|uniref:Uncharacterized protein n=1 Tax=Pseudonocardia parietis TaxID=570936 RepID=A0ABS4VX94_9PSEU|nr:hypothetical protein [Pseudonocardia parietis]MBP2368535.1 hypothetical protein [Pseudonocardia parietis]
MAARPAGSDREVFGASARLLSTLFAPRWWRRQIGLRAGALVDPSSGMLIDGFYDGPIAVDLELLGAVALDLMRISPQLIEAPEPPAVVEHPRRVLVETGRAGHMVVSHAVDQRQEPVLVVVLVEGSWKIADRIGRRLAAAPALNLHHEQPTLGHTARHRAPHHRVAAQGTAELSDVEATVRIPRPRPYMDPWWAEPPVTQDAAPSGPASSRRT